MTLDKESQHDIEPAMTSIIDGSNTLKHMGDDDPLFRNRMINEDVSKQYETIINAKHTTTIPTTKIEKAKQPRSPQQSVGDDTTASTVSVTTASSNTIVPENGTTTESLGSAAISLCKDVSKMTSLLRFDEKVLIQLRSKEMNRIVECYNQTVVFDSYGSNETVPVVKNESILPNTPSSIIPTTLAPKVKETIHTGSITSNTCPNNATTSSVVMSSNAIPTTTFVVVTGPTGSGKTSLIQSALKDRTVQRGGYYIRGLFDVAQHPDPYRAFTLAFTDYTYQVVQRGPPANIIAIQNAIQAACGSETHVLTQMIPALSAIIDYRINDIVAKENDNIAKTMSADVNTEDIDHTARTEATIVEDDDVKNNVSSTLNDDAIKRFVFVFQKFLRAISSAQQPIVLLLDDVQYADECSVDILCSIMNDAHNIPGLFVICTSTDDDLNDTISTNSDDVAVSNNDKSSYFVKCVREMELERNGSMIIQPVSIGNLNYEQLQYVLGQTLQQCSLYDIQIDDDFCTLVMNETNGNLYLTIEFLRWLANEKLLTTNCPNNCTSVYTYWAWNIDDINRSIKSLKMIKDDMKAPYSYYVSSKLENLPIEAIEVLKVGACFGSSHMDELLIEYVLDIPVHSIVADLIDMGILAFLGDGKQLCFVHETLQASVYDLISKSTCEIRHLEIGRRLWRRMDHDELERYIFVVLSQMYKGRKLITRSNERYSIAALCLHACRKAAKSSTFRVSLIYINFGIELLGERGWRDEYELTLSMYNAAAEMEVCTANYEGMELIMTQILKNARCIDDTIQARTTAVYAFGISDRQQEALALGKQLLIDLGCEMPKKFCSWSLRSEMNSVFKLLKGKSNDYLKRLPMIEDGKVLACMHVLNMMYLHSLLVGSKMSPFISLKMMKLTLIHGLSFMSPLAFSTFGIICIKAFPTTDLAFRCGDLSLELLDRFKVREYLPRVYACYYACIYHWKYPICDTLDHMIHAHNVGMQTGDVEFACLCANLWSFIAMDTDIPLDEVEHQWTNFQMKMKANKQMSSYRMSISCLQLIRYYQGKDIDFTETDALLELSIKKNLASTTNAIIWGRAKMALIFNDFPRADEIVHGAHFDFGKTMKIIPPTCEMVQMSFLNGMIALAIAAETQLTDFRPLKARKQYIKIGKDMIKFIKKFVLWSPANYVDKQLLLEAELAAVKGKQDEAMKNYICAIAASKTSHNLFVCGLANERAGKHCFFKLNQPHMAKSYLNAALLAYSEWKAHRKVNHLQNEVKDIFG